MMSSKLKFVVALCATALIRFLPFARKLLLIKARSAPKAFCLSSKAQLLLAYSRAQA